MKPTNLSWHEKQALRKKFTPSNIKDEREHMQKDAAALWLARHGGAR